MPAAEETRPRGLIEVDESMVDDISVLIDTDQRGMVLNLVADLYPADLSLLLTHVGFDRARKLFEWLPNDRAADALTELDSSYRAELLEDASRERLASLLEPLDTDDAADVLGDVSDAMLFEVLPELEDAADLQRLLGYGEETAGGIMATEFVSVLGEMTLSEVTEVVRENAEHVDELYTVFVVDEAQRLEGVVGLKHLLLGPADAAIASIMDTDLISVTTDIDQEEAARIMERYDLVSLPVLDDYGRLVGRITIDDVVDVIREEAEEDLQLMSGVTGREVPTASVFRVSRGRLPWLMIGLFGAGLSGMVIGTFEAALQQAVVLASFIPVVTAMGGNAAVQSAAISVQGLTSGDLWSGDLFRRLAKEAVVALVNGLVLSALLCVVILVLGVGDVGALAATLGLTMLAVIFLATTNGTVIPFLLERLGIDPASAMGPFVTTLNDIIGLTVYFLIASVLYL